MALPALSLSPALRKNRFLKTLIVGVYNWLLGQKGRGTIYLCIIKFYMSVFSASHLAYSFSCFSFCFSFLFITALYECLHTLDYDEPRAWRAVLFCFILLFFVLSSFVFLTILCRIVRQGFRSTRWGRLWPQDLDFPHQDTLCLFGDEIKNVPCVLMQSEYSAARSLHISLFLYLGFLWPHTSIASLLPQ